MKHLTLLPALPFLPAAAQAAPSYVAMGSSYAAGPNIGESADNPATRCARSASNAAHIVARERGLDLVDVSCSGATTAHILGQWKELPPQVDALDPSTALVTVTIGGNDLGYMTAIGQMRCPRLGETERSRYFGGTCTRFKPLDDAAKAGLASAMDKMIAAIHQRAPKAKLLIVQYFTLMPEKGNCPATSLSNDEAEQVRAIATTLTTITAQSVKPYRAFAGIIPLDRASAAHGLCSRKPWVNGASPDFSKHDGVYYHPNQAGMAGAARLILAAYR